MADGSLIFRSWPKLMLKFNIVQENEKNWCLLSASKKFVMSKEKRKKKQKAVDEQVLLAIDWLIDKWWAADQLLQKPMKTVLLLLKPFIGFGLPALQTTRATFKSLKFVELCVLNRFWLVSWVFSTSLNEVLLLTHVHYHARRRKGTWSRTHNRTNSTTCCILVR